MARNLRGTVLRPVVTVLKTWSHGLALAHGYGGIATDRDLVVAADGSRW
jgi:hypothetical protein